MGRGYSVIGLNNPKSGENVGGVRATGDALWVSA